MWVTKIYESDDFYENKKGISHFDYRSNTVLTSQSLCRSNNTTYRVRDNIKNTIPVSTNIYGNNIKRIEVCNLSNTKSPKS